MLTKKNPDTRQTRMWLVWLAQQLQRESKTEFLIEEMQPSLLKKKAQNRIYGLIPVLIFGLVGGLSGLIFGLSGLIVGLIFGLIGGLIGRYSAKIELNEKIIILKITKENIIKKLISGLIFGLICVLSPVLISVLISGVIGGQPDIRENKKNPNQGI